MKSDPPPAAARQLSSLTQDDISRHQQPVLLASDQDDICQQSSHEDKDGADAIVNDSTLNLTGAGCPKILLDQCSPCISLK